MFAFWIIFICCNVVYFVVEGSPSKKKRKFKQTTDSEKNNFAKKTRPNYFIGIQIKSPSILGMFTFIQSYVMHFYMKVWICCYL